MVRNSDSVDLFIVDHLPFLGKRDAHKFIGVNATEDNSILRAFVAYLKADNLGEFNEMTVLDGNVKKITITKDTRKDMARIEDDFIEHKEKAIAGMINDTFVNNI